PTRANSSVDIAKADVAGEADVAEQVVRAEVQHNVGRRILLRDRLNVLRNETGGVCRVGRARIASREREPAWGGAKITRHVLDRLEEVDRALVVVDQVAGVVERSRRSGNFAAEEVREFVTLRGTGRRVGEIDRPRTRPGLT